MKMILIVLGLLFLGCESNLNINSDSVKSDLIQDIYQDLQGPKCPKNHKDSIVPIVYGYPGEELFAKSDSGLVVLGGCELGDDNYFCKIHRISF